MHQASAVHIAPLAWLQHKAGAQTHAQHVGDAQYFIAWLGQLCGAQVTVARSKALLTLLTFDERSYVGPPQLMRELALEDDPADPDVSIEEMSQSFEDWWQALCSKQQQQELQKKEHALKPACRQVSFDLMKAMMNVLRQFGVHLSELMPGPQHGRGMPCVKCPGLGGKCGLQIRLQRQE